MLAYTEQGDERRWRVPGGEAVWERATGRWRRPGLEDPVLAPPGEIALRASLDEEVLVVHLATPVLVPAGGRHELRVAWPLAVEACIDDVPFDRFRPGMTRTLLGPLGSGRVMPAFRTRPIRADRPPSAGEAALDLTVRNTSDAPATLRRVAFPEVGLTLWDDGEHLRAGIVRVTLDRDGSAEARCEPAEAHADRVLRPGRPTTADGERGIRWLLDATRRSVSLGF